MGGGKPRGINAGRKLRNHRRLNRYGLTLNLLNWMCVDGPTTISTKLIRSLSGESPSRVLLTPLVSSLRRSPSRPSSPTPPSESAWEFNSRRTIKESLASFLRTVAWPSSTKMTRFLLPDSVVQATPWVTCQESDSRLSRSPVCLCTPFGSERRKSPSSEQSSRVACVTSTTTTAYSGVLREWGTFDICIRAALRLRLHFT